MGVTSVRVFLCLCALAFIPGHVLAGGKTLVLLDSHFIKETHSRFFRALKGKHFFSILERSFFCMLKDFLCLFWGLNFRYKVCSF